MAHANILASCYCVFGDVSYTAARSLFVLIFVLVSNNNVPLSAVIVSYEGCAIVNADILQGSLILAGFGEYDDSFKRL